MTYDALIEPIDDELAAFMTGRSWHENPQCPAISDLALLHLPFVGLDGRRTRGRLIVAQAVADAVVFAFARIESAGFPIAHMQLIAGFEGSDDRSMAANNCSGFNFRRIAGTDRLSKHALGLAIDINPIQNPWVRGGTVVPPEGGAYLDREMDHPGLIRPDGPVTAAFRDIGWIWGGDWDELSDYHHFEVAG